MEGKGNKHKLPSFDIEGEALPEVVDRVVGGLYSRCLLEKDGRRLRSYDKTKSSLKTWLSRVAINHIVSLQRRQGRLVPLEEASLANYIFQPGQETLLLEQERAEMFLWVRSRLSKSQRLLLDRLVRGDQDATALATELGISLDRLYDRKRKMIQRLQELLREYGKRKSRF